jgi:hypothetical protein
VRRFAVFVLLAVTLRPAALTGQGLDGRSILDRTRVTVAARKLPPFVAYTEYAAFERHGKIKARRARVVVRMADGRANITPLADSPRDRIDTQPTVKDRPLVYPTTTFGLVKRNNGERPSAFENSPALDRNQPRVIGRVEAVAQDYDATLIGTESLNGASVYHLKLVPRVDPDRHRIRALYVDTATFEPRRIAIEVQAAAGPVHSRPTVTVDFTPVDGTWVIAHAAMAFVLRLGFFNYGGSAEYRVCEVSFPAAEPAWMFDSQLLKRHFSEPAPH